VSSLPHRGAAHAERRDHFPRGRLWRRLYQDTEVALGSLPLLVVTPILTATCATFLATALPAQTVQNGVVVGPSGWLTLGLAVAGGVLGVVATAVGTFLVLLTSYLTRGDSSWNAHQWGARPEGATGPDSFGSVMLACKIASGLTVMDLGDYECWIRTPDGQVWEILDGSYGGSGRAGASAMFAELVDGKHHVRWYATKRRSKHVEIARAPIPVDRSRIRQ